MKRRLDPDLRRLLLAWGWVLLFMGTYAFVHYFFFTRIDGTMIWNEPDSVPVCINPQDVVYQPAPGAALVCVDPSELELP